MGLDSKCLLRLGGGIEAGLFSGGCELTVDVPALFREAGLEVEWMDAMYVSGFRLASYNCRGAARPR